MDISARSFERLLTRVEKPGRYLGNELGSVRKDPAAVDLRVALAFPEVYEIAQSHPGLQLLYDLLNRRPDVYAERAYAPWFDLEAVLPRQPGPREQQEQGERQDREERAAHGRRTAALIPRCEPFPAPRLDMTESRSLP